MDQTKSQEIESLKKEILRLRQQIMEMYRAWASGMPPPPFSTFDPANTLSLPPKSQSQFPTVVDAPQYASESIPRQMHLNISTTLSLAPQYKSTTFTAPYTVCVFVAQPSTKTSTLAINPTIVLPQYTSESTFNTLDDHCYTLELTVKLSGSPKFLTKKSSMLEELEKVVGKVKSVENDMKNSPGLMGCEDVSYKNWGISSSVNLPPSFEILKFGEPDRQKDSVKHLGQHCNQPRETEGKKKENAPIVIPGTKQSLRGTTHHYCQPQPRAYILDPHNYLQQGLFPQNPRNPIPLPQYPLNNAQLAEFAKRGKEKDNFTPIGESFASLFQRLVQQGMIIPLLGYSLDSHSRSFDPNIRCAYHSDVQGHSIEDCRALKREIEKMIQDKSIMVQNIDSEESSSHADMQTSG
ncbi:hypothetical protein P3S68_025985 [Capsicum galapagoense]